MPLGKTAVTESTLGPQEPRHAVPASIGHYRIVRVLGEGGMGTVYEAEQDNPRRTVALKVIRARYLSAQLLRRFEQEAQVLGRLQHPGIAQVYEAGTVKDEDGRPLPFFAMEYIQGDPLTEYASLHALGTRERLELIAKVCDAVYHAHQKGVIHRDLKPANILVDKNCQPKILDFGVARATDSDIKHTTMQTDIGQLIGTVPYMSPEQVSGNPDDLDTRSDVYALGIIAYELLSGRLPYNLDRKMIHEAVSMIRETEPTRLSSINRSLRGDIETIIAKALEKQKTRRYQSAESFASDIRRYLRDEPIAARPASTWYQLQKFSRRNKGLVSGVAAAFLVLIAGVVGTSLALRRALSAETRLTGQLAETVKARAAEAEQRRLADEQRDRAIAAEGLTKKRAEELQKVSDFQAKMFSQVDPAEAGKLLARDVQAKFVASLVRAGVPESQREEQAEAFKRLWSRVNATDAARDLFDRTILVPAVDAINKLFKDQPLLDATLSEAVADRYDYLGLYDQAIELQRRALAIRRATQGEDHRETLNAINNLGVLLKAQGSLEEAELCYREELEKSRRVMGADHPDTMVSLNNLGRLLLTLERVDEAEPYLREALEGRTRVLGEDNPNTVVSIEALAYLLEKQGKYAEAEQYACEVMEWRRRMLGDDDPDTLTAISGYGDLLNDQGKLSEAEACYRESLERSRRVLGDDHPDALYMLHKLAKVLERRGKIAEAEQVCREAVEGRISVLGETNASTWNSMYRLAVLLQKQRKFSEAEGMFRRVYELLRTGLGQDDPETVDTLYYLGIVLQAQHKFPEAEPCFRDIVNIRTRLLGASNPETLYAVNRLGGVLKAQGKAAEAISLLEPIEGDARKAFSGADSSHLITFLSSLGAARAATGQYAAAEANLLEAQQMLASAANASPTDRQDAAMALANLYQGWQSAEPGGGHDVQAATWRSRAEAEH